MANQPDTRQAADNTACVPLTAAKILRHAWSWGTRGPLKRPPPRFAFWTIVAPLLILSLHRKLRRCSFTHLAQRVVRRIECHSQLMLSVDIQRATLWYCRRKCSLSALKCRDAFKNRQRDEGRSEISGCRATCSYAASSRNELNRVFSRSAHRVPLWIASLGAIPRRMRNGYFYLSL